MNIKILKFLLVPILISRILFADCESKLAICDKLQSVSSQQIESLKVVVKRQDEYITVIEDQRNKAYDKLSSTGSNLPFYIWVLFGAAGGVVLTRGLR
jgi:hypothetical protein